MPAPAPRLVRVFVHPALAFAIHPSRWRALFRAHGAKLPVAVGASGLELARTLFGARVPESLARALDDLALLATPTGRFALLEAAAPDGRALPLGLPPGDLAAHVLTLRADDESFEPILERAHHRFARLEPEDMAHELVAREARRAGDPAACVRAVEAMLGARFVGAWTCEGDDGDVHVAIVRTQGERRVANTARKGAVRRRVQREIAADVVHVMVPGARVSIDTRDASLVRPYADAVGASLFGERGFYADAPAFTLKGIAAIGAKDLATAAVAEGITSVRAVDVRWDDGEGATMHAHASNALGARERSAGAPGGYLTSTMLRMNAPGRARSLDAAIRLPNELAVRSAVDANLVRRAFGPLGVLSPGTVPDDLWTLAPWVHAEWRWRLVIGDALFETLRAAKILVATETRMVTDPDARRFGWSYVAFEMKSEPGKYWAVPSRIGPRARAVDAASLVAWRLDLEALERALGAKLGTTEAGAGKVRAEIERSVALDLGEYAAKEVVLRLFAMVRAPGRDARAIAAAMRRAAKTAHVVVMVPEGRTMGADVMEIGVGMGAMLGAGDLGREVVARAIEKMGVEVAEALGAWRLAAPGTRVVIDAKGMRAWLDGVELTHVSEHGVKLLLILARAGGAYVRTGECDAFLSANRASAGATRRAAKLLVKGVRESFEAAGREAPKDVGRIVESGLKKGWRVRVACEVR